MAEASTSRTGSEAQPGNDAERGHIEAIEPAAVRLWRYHNRAGAGMDDPSLDDLANSIRRDGQQQPGLARRLPPGDTHLVEVIFGGRRLEACRRAHTPRAPYSAGGRIPKARARATALRRVCTPSLPKIERTR